GRASRAFATLPRGREAALPGVAPGHAESVCRAGRNMGDESRSALDRRNQKKYPGNMLERPMLLLNPWAIRTTETGEQIAAGGDDFSGRNLVEEAKPIAPEVPAPASVLRSAGGRAAEITPDLDFLAVASAAVLYA